MARRIQTKIKVRLEASNELKKLAEQIHRLVADNEFLTKLLRRAAADTILAAWRQRFYARLPELLNMQRADFDRAAVGMPDRLRDSILSVRNQLDHAVADGDFAKAAKLKDTAVDRERALRDKLKHEDASSLSTGRFRLLAIEIINIITSVEAMQVTSDKDRIVLGIGPLQRLNRIETPSATPDLTGRGTSSDLTTMWRQLEFGTGVYSTDPAGNPGSEFTEADGSWWFGKEKGKGLRLKGTPGAHAIFDANAVPYMEDALRFESVFTGLLVRALQGKS